MAESVGQIGLDLVVNQNSFNKQMAGITGLAKKAGLALASAFAVKKLIQFGKSCVELGSNLSEIQNVVETTFPTMTNQVEEFAKTAIEQFGLSQTVAKKYISTFGAMSQAFGFSEKESYKMSEALTGLAGDVASFYNMSSDEAYTKLKSVFTGETESLKDLGVVMTQTALDGYAMANGFGKTTKNMSEQEKVALRLAFVQDKLKLASGDFAKTQDSWANQTRILSLRWQEFKATLGQGFINLFTPIIKVINLILSKLATLANAFKAFTELITGKKSSKNSSGLGAMAKETANTTSGLEGATGAADNLSGATDGVGNSAKKAAKEMKGLMSFDELNTLSSNNNSDGSGGSGGASATMGESIDYGKLAEGETVLDKFSNKFKQLVDLFKTGFNIGIGKDFEKSLKRIQSHVDNIGKSLRDIFLSPEVVGAADNWVNSFIINLGKIIGSIASVGVTMAEYFVGAWDKYLSQNSNFIKDRIVSMFNVDAEIRNLVGNLFVSLASIFEVFRSDSAKQMGADLIAIFSNSFLGVMDITTKFMQDLINALVQPIVNNADLIQEALENTLAPIGTVLGVLSQSVTDTYAKIKSVYDEHIQPMFQSFAEGFTIIVETVLDAYNTYLAPVLQSLADKFEEVWGAHIQPLIDKAIEFVGKLADAIKEIWEVVIQPFIQWLIDNVVPIISPIIEVLGKIILDFAGVIADVISGILDILGGLLDFIVGVFTGDWSKAWGGIKQIFSGIWDIITGILHGFDSYLQNIFTTDWSKSFGVLGTMLNNFFSVVSDIWNGIKKIFSGIVDFVAGVFTGNWSRAWNGVKNIFKGIFDMLVGIAKAPLNAIISLINGAISGINSMIRMVNKVPGIEIGQIPKIPYLAKGGIIDSPTLAMVGEAGREAVVPLENNTGGLDLLASKLLERMPQGNSNNSFGDGDIILMIDGSVIGKVALKQLRKMQRQGNVTLIPT